MADLGTATIIFGADISPFKKNMGSIEAVLKTFGRGIAKSAGTASAALAATATNASKVAKPLKTAATESKKFGTEMGKLAKEQKKVQGETKKTTTATDKLGKSYKTAGKDAKSFFDRTQKGLANAARGFAEIAAAGAILSAPFVISIKRAIEFESAFTGVRKTLEASEAEFQKINEAFRELSKTIPVAFTELSRIGEIGGQLGVAQEDIVKFTDTIARVAVTTDLTAESAALSFARISKVMGLALNDVDLLASAIVGLGNNFAVTEPELLNFTNRLAKAGAAVGLTIDQVLGFSAALASVGVSAQAGSTAIQKTLIAIAKAVKLGGEELDTFASVAGMSAENFATAWEENAGKAFENFVIGLGKSGDDAILLLDKLEITDQRAVSAFLALASAGDEVSRALAQAAKDIANTNALIEESEKRFATMESKIDVLKNKIDDLAFSVGETLFPVVEKLVISLEKAIEKVQGFSDSSPGLVVLLAKIAGSMALAGTAFLTFGIAIRGVGFALKPFVPILKKVWSGLKILRAGIGGASAAGWVFVIAARAIFVVLQRWIIPLGLVVAAYKLLAPPIWETIKALAQEKDAIQKTKDAQDKYIDSLVEAGTITDKLAKKLKAMQDVEAQGAAIIEAETAARDKATELRVASIVKELDAILERKATMEEMLDAERIMLTTAVDVHTAAFLAIQGFDRDRIESIKELKKVEVESIVERLKIEKNFVKQKEFLNNASEKEFKEELKRLNAEADVIENNARVREIALKFALDLETSVALARAKFSDEEIAGIQVSTETFEAGIARKMAARQADKASAEDAAATEKVNAEAILKAMEDLNASREKMQDRLDVLLEERKKQIADEGAAELSLNTEILTLQKSIRVSRRETSRLAVLGMQLEARERFKLIGVEEVAIENARTTAEAKKEINAESLKDAKAFVDGIVEGNDKLEKSFALFDEEATDSLLHMVAGLQSMGVSAQNITTNVVASIANGKVMLLGFTDEAVKSAEKLIESERALGKVINEEEIKKQRVRAETLRKMKAEMQIFFQGNKEILDAIVTVTDENVEAMHEVFKTAQATSDDIGIISDEVKANLHKWAFTHHDSPSPLDKYQEGMKKVIEATRETGVEIEKETGHIRRMWAALVDVFNLIKKDLTFKSQEIKVKVVQDRTAPTSAPIDAAPSPAIEAAPAEVAAVNTKFAERIELLRQEIEAQGEAARAAVEAEETRLASLTKEMDFKGALAEIEKAERVEAERREEIEKTIFDARVQRRGEELRAEFEAQNQKSVFAQRTEELEAEEFQREQTRAEIRKQIFDDRVAARRVELENELGGMQQVANTRDVMNERLRTSTDEALQIVVNATPETLEAWEALSDGTKESISNMVLSMVKLGVSTEDMESVINDSLKSGEADYSSLRSTQQASISAMIKKEQELGTAIQTEISKRTQALDTEATAREDHVKVIEVADRKLVTQFQEGTDDLSTELDERVSELDNASEGVTDGMDTIRTQMERWDLENSEGGTSPAEAYRNSLEGMVNATNTAGGAIEHAIGILRGLWLDFGNFFNTLTQNMFAAMQRLNPLARFSPSLVDNVRTGTKEVEKTYSEFAGRLVRRFLEVHAAKIRLLGLGDEKKGLFELIKILNDPKTNLQKGLAAARRDLDQIQRAQGGPGRTEGILPGVGGGRKQPPGQGDITLQAIAAFLAFFERREKQKKSSEESGGLFGEGFKINVDKKFDQTKQDAVALGEGLNVPLGLSVFDNIVEDVLEKPLDDMEEVIDTSNTIMDDFTAAVKRATTAIIGLSNGIQGRGLDGDAPLDDPPNDDFTPPNDGSLKDDVIFIPIGDAVKKALEGVLPLPKPKGPITLRSISGVSKDDMEELGPIDTLDLASRLEKAGKGVKDIERGKDPAKVTDEIRNIIEGLDLVDIEGADAGISELKKALGGLAEHLDTVRPDELDENIEDIFDRIVESIRGIPIPDTGVNKQDGSTRIFLDLRELNQKMLDAIEERKRLLELVLEGFKNDVRFGNIGTGEQGGIPKGEFETSPEGDDFDPSPIISTIFGAGKAIANWSELLSGTFDTMERIEDLDLEQLRNILAGFNNIDIENAITNSNANNSAIISRASNDLLSINGAEGSSSNVTIAIESVRSDEDIIAIAELAFQNQQRVRRR